MRTVWLPKGYRIGSLSDDLKLLADTVWEKCLRATVRQESIVVLADPDGNVFVAMSRNGAALRALNRNPSWLVGTYSMVNKHNIDCMPNLDEIAEDLAVRAVEVMMKRAA